MGFKFDWGKGRPSIGNENRVRSIDIRLDVNGSFNLLDVFGLPRHFVDEGSRGFCRCSLGVRGHVGALWVASACFRVDMKRILVVCSN